MEELQPFTEERPWGLFRQFVLNKPVTVKIISVKAGEGTSLQSHSKRGEFWRVISGEPILTIGNSKHHTSIGQEFFVSQGEEHRIEGGEAGGELLEISLGEFDENDIYRIEDKYGRN
jgi:mannose-6-phosphate isomerase